MGGLVNGSKHVHVETGHWFSTGRGWVDCKHLFVIFFSL